MTNNTEKIEKRLCYMSVKFDGCDIKEVYHHLNLNYKVSDFIIANDRDNDRIIGEIFTPVRTKVKVVDPRFLKLVGGGQGVIILDKTEQFTVEDIMSTDPMYLVKGTRYKPSNATLPTLNEAVVIPTRNDIIDVIRETCGELTRTMNAEPHDPRTDELEAELREKEETIDKLERELRARDVRIERLGEQFNDEMRKKTNEISKLKEEHLKDIAKLKEEHNAEVVSMGLELSEKDAMIEKLKDELEALKNQYVEGEDEEGEEGVPVIKDEEIINLMETGAKGFGVRDDFKVGLYGPMSAKVKVGSKDIIMTIDGIIERNGKQKYPFKIPLNKMYGEEITEYIEMIESQASNMDALKLYKITKDRVTSKI